MRPARREHRPQTALLIVLRIAQSTDCPTMLATQTRTIPEAHRGLADIVTAAYDRAERTIITRGGQPVAAVVPLKDVEAMEALEDMMDFKVATKRLASFHEQGGTTLEAFRRELVEELGKEQPEGK